MFFRAPKSNLPPYDLLANLKDALRKLESDALANTPNIDNLKRILRDRIALLETEASKRD